MAEKTLDLPLRMREPRAADRETTCAIHVVRAAGQDAHTDTPVPVRVRGGEVPPEF